MKKAKNKKKPKKILMTNLQPPQRIKMSILQEQVSKQQMFQLIKPKMLMVLLAQMKKISPKPEKLKKKKLPLKNRKFWKNKKKELKNKTIITLNMILAKQLPKELKVELMDVYLVVTNVQTQIPVLLVFLLKS